MLIAGHDPEEGPQLFFIDYLASLIEIPYITHGYPGIVTLSIMGEYHRSGKFIINKKQRQ
jgi:20S proteasome, alpha and beta subunits